VRLNGLDFAVIGITAESFTGIEHMLRPAFYVPAMMGPALSPAGDDLLTDRGNRNFFVKGRLKAGVSIPGASAEVAAIAKSLEESYPATNRAFGAAVFTERQERLFFDGPYDDQLVKMLFVLVIIVLSIACANVANLMLSRGRARAREIAVRLAIGSSRVRLVRQLLAESLLISLAGGALGLIIAQAAVTAFSSLIQIPSDLPLEFNFRLDYRVSIFTALVSVVSAILFGLVPALQSTKTDLLTALKAGEADDARKRLFGRRALVVVQIAGSLVLLIAASEIYAGIKASLAADPGFRIDHRLTIRFAPETAGYTPERTDRFYKTLLEKSRTVPGVQTAALSAGLPMTSNLQIEVVHPEGYQFRSGQEGDRVLADYVSDRYFETFAIPMLAGRGFLETDGADSTQVAVVNEAFARRYFNGNPIGKRLRIERDGPWIEVVGMTRTGKYVTAFEGVDPFLFLPYTQHQETRMTLIVETQGEPSAMSQPLREMVRSVDPAVPVYAVRTMEDLFDQRSVKIADLFIGVVAALGAMGLVLALVGLYAVVAYQVSRRKREIGIRVALGAERQQVVMLIVKYAAGMVVAGVGIGIALSIVGNHYVAVGLIAMGPQILTPDFTWVATAICALLLTTFAASAIPAWRAAHVDPMRALRQD
jgi:predicted permease